MPSPTLILASRSPRRAQLLREAGYRFLQIDPPFADPPGAAESAMIQSGDPALAVRDLAAQKALSLLNDNSLHSYTRPVILTADTIVIAPSGRLLGQPLDQRDAAATLGQLLGQEHQVVTGVVLVDGQGRQDWLTDTARVRLGPVAGSVLQQYLESGQWQGKAGGYNLLELQGHWPLTVEGDPSTVAGLPMRKLAQHLCHWGIMPQPGEGRKTPLP